MLSTLIQFRENCCQGLYILSLHTFTQARGLVSMNYHCGGEGQPLLPLVNGLELSTFSEEGADLSTNSKLNPSDSPGFLDYLFRTIPHPHQVFSHPSLLPAAWDRPHSLLELRRFAFFPLVYTHPAPKLAPPRRSLLRAPPSRPVPCLPSNPGSSPPRAPQPRQRVAQAQP